jgi:hypothetical protein
MKKSLIAVAAGALMIAAPAFATMNNPAGASASLLNKANQMNNQEEDLANMLNSKAGDNQALITLATTMKDDHEANESAVKAVANQENITLNSYHANHAAMKKLDNLNGSDFNQTFLKMEAQDHRKALQEFEAARGQPQNRDMKVYIDETIPVLRSHLEMIENLRRDMAQAGSPENPANNRETSRR